MNDESHPKVAHEIPARSESSLSEFRRRRLAALRCEPLIDGRRDPLFELIADQSPSDYGMSPVEIVDYANHLARNGWLNWEIRSRLADPKRVAA